MRRNLAFLGLAPFLLAILAPGTAADPAVQPKVQPTVQKDWTVIVFANGNNSLDSDITDNLNEMEQVGSTDQVNVVVQWASLSRGDTERLLIRKDADPHNVTSPVIQDLGGSVDMGDSGTLIDFAQWAITNYPAKHYLLDVSDHGSGWHSVALVRPRDGALAPMDISYDQTTGHWITTPQLGMAVGQVAQFIGHPLDVYASDACLMEMAEIAGEMLGSVQVYAGSEETEPLPGWSYADFLKLLTAKPEASPSAVGTFLEQSYVAAYSGGVFGNEDVTFAALDMTAFPAFEAAVKKFGAALSALDAGDAAKVRAAAGNSLYFTDSDYIDLSNFLTTLAPSNIASLGGDATGPLKTALTSLIISNGDTGVYAGRATGLSMWIPSTENIYRQYLPIYTQLKFDQATGWSSALKQLLAGAKS